MTIEANGYRFDTETGKIQVWSTGSTIRLAGWRPVAALNVDSAESLIAAAITATRAEPIEVRYRWDDDDQKYLYSLIEHQAEPEKKSESRGRGRARYP